MNDDTTNTGVLHPVHVGHLVMGLAFLGLVGIWAVVGAELVPTDDVRWLLPLPWVFAGAAGLLAVVLSGRKRSAAAAPAPTAWRATPEERAADPVAEDSELIDDLTDHPADDPAGDPVDDLADDPTDDPDIEEKK
jgi:hypothetical protein